MTGGVTTPHRCWLWELYDLPRLSFFYLQLEVRYLFVGSQLAPICWLSPGLLHLGSSMPPLSSLSPSEADIIILNTGEDPVVQRDESTQCLAGEGRI